MSHGLIMAKRGVGGSRIERAVRNLLAGTDGFWLDASDPATLFSDDAGTVPAAFGGTIGCIKDKLGRGINFTQATAGNRPTWSADADGFPTLLFDGTNDRLTSNVFGALGDPHTIIFGVRYLSARTHYLLDNVAVTAPRVAALANSSYQQIVSDSGSSITSGATSVNAATTFNIIRNGNTPASSIQKGDDARVTGSQTTTDDPTQFILGCRYDFAGFLHGRVTNLLFVRALLTQTQIDLIKDYIRSKGAFAA